MRKLSLLLLSSLVSFHFVQAQSVAINTDGSTAHPSAMLEVKSTSKGLLIPRVALTATNVAAPVPAPATSLLVYNTETAGSGATAVSPGFYFWDGAWVRLTPNTTSVAAWALGGNAGTTAANFIGTTDNQPLIFKTNNGLAGQVHSSLLATANNNTSFGFGALFSTVFNPSQPSVGNFNVALGNAAMFQNTTGSFNVAVGLNALTANTEGNFNAATGGQALQSNTTGSGNTAVGYVALSMNQAADNNTAIGSGALNTNISGTQNTGLGTSALKFNSEGNYNTAVGYTALFNNTESRNTAVGHSALFKNTSGADNTAIGYKADVFVNNLNNATAIGAYARTDCNNCLVLGSINAVNGAAASARVGIGTSDPVSSAILHLKSTTAGFLAPRMTLAERNVILNPATGLLIYQTNNTPGFYYNSGTESAPAWTALSGGSSGWSLNGNTGTTEANFIGTIDHQPLIFRSNGALAGRIQDGGNFSTTYGYSAGSKMIISDIDPDIVANGNTAIGYKALRDNVSGDGNTAVGSSALLNNEANDNTATGVSALSGNTTGSHNTAIGSSALANNINGEHNTAAGKNALGTNSTGSDNTATGSSALESNTTADGNTAMGKRSLQFNTTGHSNTATGANSLWINTIGQANTANGFGSLGSNIEGNSNTAIGAGSLGANTYGEGNTAVGHEALFANTDGGHNTAIGAGANVSSGVLSNATAIGYQAIVNASNTVQIGNASVSNIYFGNPNTTVLHAASLNTTSDARFKFNVAEDVKGLDFILKLRPVTYHFSEKMMQSGANKFMQPASYNESTAQRHTGFIAQEVEKAAVQSGFNFNGVHKPKTDKEYYSLSYASFVVPLVKAVQEQQAVIDQQAEELKKLKQQIESLTKAVQKLSPNQ